MRPQNFPVILYDYLVIIRIIKTFTYVAAPLTRRLGFASVWLGYSFASLAVAFYVRYCVGRPTLVGVLGGERGVFSPAL